MDGAQLAIIGCLGLITLGRISWHGRGASLWRVAAAAVCDVAALFIAYHAKDWFN